MPTSNKLVLTFNDYTKLPKEAGLYFVLFRIDKGDALVGFDWGFNEYNGTDWAELSSEIGRAKVVKWCHMPKPEMLLM